MKRVVMVAAMLAATMTAALAGPLAVEASATSERLSGGRSDWRAFEALALWRDPADWSASAALRHTERFGLGDNQVEGTGAWRLAPRWRAETELAYSGTHQVLPEWRLRSRLWLLDVGGWNLAAGAGRTLYRSGAAGVQGSNVAEWQAERYAGNFRFAYVGSLTQLDAGGSGGAHQWRLDWYRDERLTLGALLAFGRELEN